MDIEAAQSERLLGQKRVTLAHGRMVFQTRGDRKQFSTQHRNNPLSIQENSGVHFDHVTSAKRNPGAFKSCVPPVCESSGRRSRGARYSPRTGVTPTSVKKPAIPAWQEPCSSPYFFLYSGGGGEGREQTTARSVCARRVWGGRAGHFPGCCCGLGPGTPSSLRHARQRSLRNPARPRKSSRWCHQLARLPSAPEASSRMWGERSSSRGDGGGGG